MKILVLISLFLVHCNSVLSQDKATFQNYHERFISCMYNKALTQDIFLELFLDSTFISEHYFNMGYSNDTVWKLTLTGTWSKQQKKLTLKGRTFLSESKPKANYLPTISNDLTMYVEEFYKPYEFSDSSICNKTNNYCLKTISHSDLLSFRDLFQN